MLKNYLTVAVRSVLKNRLCSAINVFGLAVGLASCILILLYVRHETSYDTWLPNAERIYMLQARFDIPGRAPMIGASAPGPALPAILKDFSQIESGVRVITQRPVIKRGAEVFRDPVYLADPAFFDVLDLPMISGNGPAAMKDTSSVLLSESMARKYFGTIPPIGQVMPVTFSFGSRDYRVAGVFKDLPSNTHLDIGILAPINEPDFAKMDWMLRSWVSTNPSTYIQLKPGADIDSIRRAMRDFQRRNIPDLSFGGQDFKVADMITLSLLNVQDVHLHSAPSGLNRPVGNVKVIATFSVVAVMILLIACINFTNLATARASQRAREVALRKVLGAKRPQLVAQFLSESVLMALLAFAVSLVLIRPALPVYNTLLQRELSLSFVGADGLLPAMAGLISLVGLAAGLYPALYLSGFLPARILKANKSAAAEGSGRLRSALVVIQFAISIGLLICTAVVYGQTVYARTMDLGYDRSGLMIVRGLGGESYKALRSSLLTEITKVKGVTAATLSADVPTDNNNNNNILEIPGRESLTPIVIGQQTVDYDFFTTYRIPLVAGRFFDRDHGGDDFSGTIEQKQQRGANILLNQTVLSRLGFASPAEAIGKTLRMGVGGPEQGLQSTVTIVGVVADIFYRSVRDELAPAFFQRDDENFRNLTLRFEGVSQPAMLEAVGKVWRQLAPELPYRAEFMEALIDAQYQREEAEATMFAAFSLLAIVIGCLGLYGLASFSAERRTKEIGIRKVLGAKARDVVRLLVWDFSKPVLVANAIAWPIAWFLMRDWLDGFQHRIGLNPAIFAVAGIVALLIAWITVASHAARAARANPIRALRYE